MNTITPIRTPSVEELESLFLEFNLDDEAKCTLNHDLIVLPCSVTIFAAGRACQYSAQLCQIAYQFVDWYMRQGGDCPWCARPAAACWKISIV